MGDFHIKRDIERLSGPAAIISAWLVTRIYLLMWLAYHPPNNADAELYARWATTLWNGSFPEASDNFWQYPPFFGAFIMLVGSTPLHASVILIVLSSALDLAITTLLIWRARTRDGSFLGPWSWVIGGLAIGPLLYETLDLVPATFAAFGLILASRDHLRTAGISLGLGVATKLWPLVLLAGFRPRGFFRAVLWLIAAAIAASFSMAIFLGNAQTFLSNQAGRGLQIEAVAATPWLIARLFNLETPTSGQFGSIDFIGTPAVIVGFTISALGFIAIAGLWVLRMRNRLDGVSIEDTAFLALLILVVTSRVNSPQFSIWLIAIGCVALANSHSRMQLPFLALLLAALMGQGVIAFYDSFLGAQLIPTSAQVLRALLMVLALALAVAKIRSAVSNTAPRSSDTYLI